MSKPLLAMTLNELVMLGHYHVAALEHTEETKSLISDFAKALDVLEGAMATDRRAQRNLTAASIPTKFAEHAARQVMRHMAQLARGPDDSETPLYEALFPFGLEATLASEGESLLADAFILIERLAHLRSAKDLKTQVITDLREALATLGQRLSTLEEAELVATRAREHAERARTAFLAAYERDAVAIEKLFPDSPRLQDAYFDERHVDYELMSADADWWPTTGKKRDGRPS